MKIFQPRFSIGSTLIGRYEIAGEIGQGGMQQVFLAKDHALARNVVLKTPINQSAAKRFERSARISATISHPNIAKTLDYYSDSNIEFLIEELIPGKNFQQRLDTNIIHADPHLAAHLIHHVAKAVAAMNNKGIIHRDLKPSNIMVSDDTGIKDVKVTDFGIATMADAEISLAVNGGNASIAASKTVVGALAFMAPELIRKKNDTLDRSKCDAWSIGALLYYLLFRDYPFGEELEATANILTGTYPDNTRIINQTKVQFRDLRIALWDIVRRCLVISTEDRLDANQVADLLSKITYSAESRKIGRVKYINPNSGNWGFIKPSDDSEDVFFHYDSVFSDEIRVGLEVSYTSFPGTPQARAFPVVPYKS
jgi:eukaryotic-like serine/threonine-protein kinase